MTELLIKRGRGRPAGTVIDGSLVHDLLKLERHEVMLKYERGPHTRVNIAAAIKAAAKHHPEHRFTFATCAGFELGPPEGTTFRFFKIQREW